MAVKRFYFFGSYSEEWLELSVDNTLEANITIGTISGNDYTVDWGDGNVQTFSSGTTVTHTYSTNFSGSVKIKTNNGAIDISRFQSIGSTAWDFDLGVFVPLTGLTDFNLADLPNANITGSINSFIGANGLIDFILYNLPNASITGSINSFSGATGLVNFWIYNLPNASITGNSSAFSNKTNLRDFLLYTSPTSNITIDYDDILNIWQSSVYINHRYSGISASKPTTSPFNFNSMRQASFYFQGIGLSTQSMDNMIIALNNSLIAQASPKTIRLDQNASHSGSPAVMTALSGLASKNITVVL